MAFTKVSPAGIGSTPGDGYRIGDSFLHSTGVEITNINATGILTAASLDISGDIDFDGHTNLDNVSIAGVTTFATNTTIGGNLTVNGTNTILNTTTYVKGGEGAAGILAIYADEGDDVADMWRLKSDTDGTFKLDNYAGSAWETNIKATGNGAVELFFDNSKKLETTGYGINITAHSDIRFTNGNWTGDIINGKIQLHNNILYLCSGTEGFTFREGNTDRWRIDPNGHFLPAADSTYDMGTSGVRVRNFYADTLYGDGSNLTGIVGVTINNNTDNRVATCTGTTGTLNGESNVNINGGILIAGHTASTTVSDGEGPFVQVKGPDSRAGASFIRHSADAAGGGLYIGKSRNATIGSNTIVQNGDELGRITFSGDDGNDIHTQAAAIKAYVDGTPGGNDMPGSLRFYTNVGGSGVTERFRIASDGKFYFGNQTVLDPAINNAVGLSGSGVLGFLSISRNSDVPFVIGRTGTDGDLARFYHAGSMDGVLQTSSGGIKLSGNNYLALGTSNGTERFRITSGGSVNIATTSSRLSQTTFKSQIETGTNKLISFGDAEGSQSDKGSAIIFSRPSNGAEKICAIFQHTNQSLGIAARDDFTVSTGGNAFYHSTTERLRIDSSGRVRINGADYAYSANVGADDLIIGDDSIGEWMGLTIASSSGYGGMINFGDASHKQGYIQYRHNGDRFEIGTAGSERLRIDNVGRVLVNTTTAYSGDNTMIISGGSPSGTYVAYDGQLLLTGDETSGAADTGACIQFYGHDGGSSRGLGNIRCLLENGTSGNHNAYMAFYTRTNASNPAERLRIDSSGVIEAKSNSIRFYSSGSNPSSPQNGDTYYNTTENALKSYVNGSWLIAAGEGNIVSSGSTAVYTVGGQKYLSHAITSSGIVTVTGNTMEVDYLIIAGGGGGGCLGGGGGAGGVLTGAGKQLNPGNYNVTIGAGGLNGGDAVPGATGGNTTAFGFTALGGGGGGSHDGGSTSVSGTNGGSGGGGSDNNNSFGPGSGTSGQGNNGGNGSPQYADNYRGGGGGGGAGGVGLAYNVLDNGNRGNGGVGIQNAYETGSNNYYAGGGGKAAYAGASDNNAGDGGHGGGGGGSKSGGGSGGAGDAGLASANGRQGGAGSVGQNNAGGNGGANTGGGGGCNAWQGSGGASGGSGIIIIRYKISN